MKKQQKTNNAPTVENRRARFEYHLEQQVTAGIALEGWEVKGLRAGTASLVEAFVQIHQNEAWLHNCRITPLKNACSHHETEPTRRRKLLLTRREIDSLQEASERNGYSLIPTAIIWVSGRAKLQMSVGKGKKLHDKRDTIRERDWTREQSRLTKLARTA